jgi:hypothetical protein
MLTPSASYTGGVLTSGGIMITNEQAAAAESFNNTYHKVPAEVGMDLWQAIWSKAVSWSETRAMSRYEVLREVYRAEHPRITYSAIDAFVDGRIAGEGVGAGPEAGENTENTPPVGSGGTGL